jgi:hypothetical protein
LAKPNYQFEKRQRDLAKKKKQLEKRERKLGSKTAADEGGSGSATGPGEPTPGNVGVAPVETPTRET